MVNKVPDDQEPLSSESEPESYSEASQVSTDAESRMAPNQVTQTQLSQMRTLIVTQLRRHRTLNRLHFYHVAFASVTGRE